MIKLKKSLLLSCLLFFVMLFGACDLLKFKTPIDYGESKWISGENDLIKIEMFVDSDSTAYSLVTLNGVSRKFDNSFISEMIYFLNIDENGNLILEDGHVTGFSAGIIDALDGYVSCKMDLDDFKKEFSDNTDLAISGEYYFTLTIVSNIS